MRKPRKTLPHRPRHFDYRVNVCRERKRERERAMFLIFLHTCEKYARSEYSVMHFSILYSFSFRTLHMPARASAVGRTEYSFISAYFKFPIETICVPLIETRSEFLKVLSSFERERRGGSNPLYSRITMYFPIYLPGESPGYIPFPR